MFRFFDLWFAVNTGSLSFHTDRSPSLKQPDGYGEDHIATSAVAAAALSEAGGGPKKT